MKKTMIFSTLAFFVMTLFAFTPAETSQAENFNSMFTTCTGVIQASAQNCVKTDPSDATITITNIETGAVAYTGPANGNPASVTLVAGKYVITSDSRECGQVNVQYEFCGQGAGAPYTYVNGTVTIGFLEIC